jgi:hypothetical protein
MSDSKVFVVALLLLLCWERASAQQLLQDRIRGFQDVKQCFVLADLALLRDLSLHMPKWKDLNPPNAP